MAYGANPSVVAEIVGGLYDAALDDRLWNHLPEHLATALGSSSAVLKVHGPGDDVDLLATTENLVIAPKHKAWADHWHSRDLWVQLSVQAGLSKVVISEELLPASAFEETGFYQDWNRHIGVYHMIGSVFSVDERHSGVLGVHRDRGRAGYQEDDRETVAVLLPHLQRALRLRAEMARARDGSQATLEVLDRLAVAAVVVDGQSRIRYASRRAEAMFRDTSEVNGSGGRLGLSDPELDSRLHRQIRHAAALAAGGLAAADQGLAVPRERNLPITLLVAPMRRGQAEPVVIVLLRDPEHLDLSTDLLRALYGLTPAEAAVAVAVVEGLRPDAVAVRFGIGVGTVRSHLKAILAKTGAQRQSQLVGILSRSIAALASASPRQT